MAEPNDAYLSETPPEEIGAETQARFRYQAELAARSCLAMLTGAGIERVICEWHEDYAVCFREGRTTLVSVKHLEDSQPRWTVKALVVDGGIAHLYERWRAMKEKPSCLLQTNSGMRTGSGQPAELKRCCAEAEDACLAAWALTLVPLLEPACAPPAPTPAEVARFLRDLRIEDGLPKRGDIRAANVAGAMPDVLAELGKHSSDAPAVYDAVVAEVERAMRCEGPEDVLGLLADPGRLEGDEVATRHIELKTVDRDRLLRAIARMDAGTAGPLQMLDSDQHPSRLIAKLERGAFGPTAINDARNLRLNWEHHVRRWSTDLPTPANEFSAVAATVLHAAQRAEGQARTTGTAYGPRMLQRLQAELDALTVGMPGCDPADPRLLLGCAFALTEECTVWWSDEFVLDPAG